MDSPLRGPVEGDPGQEGEERQDLQVDGRLPAEGIQDVGHLLPSLLHRRATGNILIFTFKIIGIGHPYGTYSWLEFSK